MNGNVGTPWRGGRTEIGGPSPDDGWAWGRPRRCTLCNEPDSGHSILTLAASPVRRFPSPSPLACRPAEKNPAPPHTRLRTRLSKWAAQRETFERASGELPGGAVELDSARGRPQTCTVCNNSDSRSLLAHPHFFFRAPFPLTVGTCLDVCILCTRLSKVTGPAPRSLFAFYLLISDIVLSLPFS